MNTLLGDASCGQHDGDGWLIMEGTILSGRDANGCGESSTNGIFEQQSRE